MGVFLLMKKKTMLLWIMYGNNKYNCITEGKKGKKRKKNRNSHGSEKAVVRRMC